MDKWCCYTILHLLQLKKSTLFLVSIITPKEKQRKESSKGETRAWLWVMLFEGFARENVTERVYESAQGLTRISLNHLTRRYL